MNFIISTVCDSNATKRILALQSREALHSKKMAYKPNLAVQLQLSDTKRCLVNSTPGVYIWQYAIVEVLADIFGCAFGFGGIGAMLRCVRKEEENFKPDCTHACRFLFKDSGA